MIVLVLLIVGTVTPSTAITPVDTRESVVSEALPSSIVVTCGLAEYAGATHTPPDTRTLHTATSARRLMAVVLEAVIISPIACDARVILLQSLAATVFEVVGNVIVVPSVPASVRVFDADKTFPLVTLAHWYETSQLAAVVGVATRAVNIAVV